MNTKTILVKAFCILFFSLLTHSTSHAQDGDSMMRRTIDSDNPLFVYSSVYAGSPPSQLRNFWAVLPEDVKPYFGVHVNPKKSDSPETREWIESILDVAQELGCPAIIETEGFDSQNDTPMEYWDSLFKRYPVLIGLNISEISATGGLAAANLNDQFMKKITRYIDVAALNDGYFIWQDMGWDWPFPKAPHVFVKAGVEEALFNHIKNNSQNVILTHKHNGNGRRSTTDAAAMGFWLTGFTAAWGVHSEGWMWWEAGYSRLFEPSKEFEREKESWKSVFTYPDALYGTEWMIGAAGGASLYSLEAYFQGYSSCDGSKMTPAFEHVVLPFIRQIISNKLIASREQVLEKTKAAYRPAKSNPRTLRKDHLFTGLYGPDENPHYEWLPSTGRYFFIPIIPALAPPETEELFEFVFDDKYYGQNFVKKEKKKAFFDNLYKPDGEGTSWIVNIGDNWYIANPNENEDVTTTFKFESRKNSGVKVTGALPPHTFIIVHEKDGSLSIHASNHRINANKDVWDNEDLAAGKACEYVDKVYVENPTDDELRTTEIAITGTTGEPAIDAVFGHLGEINKTVIDNETELNINHNGPVDIEVLF